MRRAIPAGPELRDSATDRETSTPRARSGHVGPTMSFGISAWVSRITTEATGVTAPSCGTAVILGAPTTTGSWGCVGAGAPESGPPREVFRAWGEPPCTPWPSPGFHARASSTGAACDAEGSSHRPPTEEAHGAGGGGPNLSSPEILDSSRTPSGRLNPPEPRPQTRTSICMDGASSERSETAGIGRGVDWSGNGPETNPSSLDCPSRSSGPESRNGLGEDGMGSRPGIPVPPETRRDEATTGPDTPNGPSASTDRPGVHGVSSLACAPIERRGTGNGSLPGRSSPPTRSTSLRFRPAKRGPPPSGSGLRTHSGAIDSAPTLA